MQIRQFRSSKYRVTSVSLEHHARSVAENETENRVLDSISCVWSKINREYLVFILFSVVWIAVSHLRTYGRLLVKRYESSKHPILYLIDCMRKSPTECTGVHNRTVVSVFLSLFLFPFGYIECLRSYEMHDILRATLYGKANASK